MPAPELRDRLVRRAIRLGADAVSAEDLAQETLLTGWRLRDRLVDPSGVEQWHYAILRNLHRRWATARREALLPEDHADEIDLEVELERRELVDLLDRALAALPEQTRDVLVHRYVEESPIREVAERLGLSEGAVQMRIARGKLALRQAMTTEAGAAYGFVDDGWKQTRIWCPMCGSRRWSGRFRGTRRQLTLRCEQCLGWDFQDTDTYRFGVTGFRAVMRKSASDGFAFWDNGNVGVQTHPHRMQVRRGSAPDGTDWAVATCNQCAWQNAQTLEAQALFTPTGMQFWREHPRIRRIAYQELESGGVPAVLTSYQAVDSADRLDVVLTKDTFHVVKEHRS